MDFISVLTQTTSPVVVYHSTIVIFPKRAMQFLGAGERDLPMRRDTEREREEEAFLLVSPQSAMPEHQSLTYQLYRGNRTPLFQVLVPSGLGTIVLRTSPAVMPPMSARSEWTPS